MTKSFNSSDLVRTLGATFAALVLGSTCLLAAAGPAKAHTPTVQTESRSVIIHGE